MISSGPMLSLIAVEPRRSGNHSTALMRSDAARYAPAQHLFGGVAPEIDAAQGAGDIHLGSRLDREPQHRHQIAQGRQGLLTEAVGARWVHTA